MTYFLLAIVPMALATIVPQVFHIMFLLPVYAVVKTVEFATKVLTGGTNESSKN